jgi:hypothetical protein
MIATKGGCGHGEIKKIDAVSYNRAFGKAAQPRTALRPSGGGAESLRWRRQAITF